MPHDQFTSHGHVAARTVDREDLPMSPASFNLESALMRLRGDRDLLAALIDIFLEDAPPLMERIKAAYLARDESALHFAAHSLRGLASNFDARHVTDPALCLEYLAATSGEFDGDGDTSIAQLDSAVAELSDGLRKFRR